MSWRRKNRPGRGCYMDFDVIHRLVIDIFRLRPCMLEEKYGCSHGVATRALSKAKGLGLTEDSVRAMTPKEFAGQWYRRDVRGKVNGQSCEYLQPDFAKMQEIYAASRKHGGSGTEIKCELTRIEVVNSVYFSDENKVKASSEYLAMYAPKSVVRLWGKYINSAVPVSFRKHHEMGGEIQLDFTGVTVPYGSEGEGRSAQVMLMTLPASRYITARAIASQKLDDVIHAIVDCLRELGGVPDMLVVDNFKGAVTKASVYGGIPNDKMLALCNFFGMELHACRPHKPKDKGSVEAAVKIVTRSALSHMRAKIANSEVKYSSVVEVNKALQGYIKAINQHEVRSLKLSRNELFSKEKEYLRIPASWDYSVTRSNVQTVPSSSLIELGKHQYALPSKWIGSQVVVEVHPRVIRFLSNNSLIVSYERRDDVTGLSAQPSFYTDERMLSFERYALEQDDFLLQWARAEGDDVASWAAELLRRHARKSEAVKQVVKVLSLPKGCVLLYNTLNQAVAQNKIYIGYPAVTSQIIRDFEALNPVYDVRSDERYNAANYDRLCRDVIYGRLPKLQWPVISQNPQPRAEGGEYLQGSERLRQRYQAVSAVLESAVTEGC